MVQRLLTAIIVRSINICSAKTWQYISYQESGGKVARKSPAVCRHELFTDAYVFVEVQRCKICRVIPDPIHAALWEFEIQAWHKVREWPVLVDRVREVERLVKDEIKARTTRTFKDSA